MEGLNEVEAAMQATFPYIDESVAMLRAQGMDVEDAGDNYLIRTRAGAVIHLLKGI